MAPLTRYEHARVIGARALQIAHGAPILVEVAGPVIDPVRVAEAEQAAGASPITVLARARRARAVEAPA